MFFEFFKKKLCRFFVHKWRSTIFPVCGFFFHNSQIGVKTESGFHSYLALSHDCKRPCPKILNGTYQWHKSIIFQRSHYRAFIYLDMNGLCYKYNVYTKQICILIRKPTRLTSLICWSMICMDLKSRIYIHQRTLSTTQRPLLLSVWGNYWKSWTIFFRWQPDHRLWISKRIRWTSENNGSNRKC